MQAAAPERTTSSSSDVLGVPMDTLTSGRCSARPGLSLFHRIDLTTVASTANPAPRGRLYSLAAPEREAMDTYINNYLAVGVIRLSSSPAGGFFFVAKKDKCLCLSTLPTS